MSHKTGVATQPGPGGMSATVAYCSCGWKAGAYRTRDEAQEAAQRHALAPCNVCGGTGYNPPRQLAHGGYGFGGKCEACKGDGTQIRADLELIADLASTPSVGRDRDAA